MATWFPPAGVVLAPVGLLAETIRERDQPMENEDEFDWDEETPEALAERKLQAEFRQAYGTRSKRWPLRRKRTSRLVPERSK